jgi:hypothetical protein
VRQHEKKEEEGQKELPLLYHLKWKRELGNPPNVWEIDVVQDLTNHRLLEECVGLYHQSGDGAHGSCEKTC